MYLPKHFEQPDLALLAELMHERPLATLVVVSMLLIEQNVGIALEIAERVYVLEGGRIASEGKPKELLATRHIREAYLGEDVGGGAR